jgi:hypothetical protein
MTSPRNRSARRARLTFTLLAALAAAVPAAALVGVQPASATTASFTTITSSANPVEQGVSFTIEGTECTRVSSTHPGGYLVFDDLTTQTSLAAVTLTPDPGFANCSDANYTDSESLAVGNYKIRARYVPDFPNPAPPSRAATYIQSVISPPFTNITWKTGAAIPHAHEEGTSAALGGKVYAIGGSTGDCSDGSCGPLQTAVDVYRPSTNTFSSAPGLPNPRTADPTAVATGGKIYVLGGINTGGTVSAIDVFTPGSGWTTLPSTSNLPTGFTGEYSCAAAVGPDIYYFDNATGDIGILNTAASPPTWSVTGPFTLLSPASFCSAVGAGTDPTSASSKVIVVGPGNGSADANSRRVLIYTPSTGTLALAQGQTAPTAEQSAVLIKGVVVTAGGDFNLTSVAGIAPGQGSVTTFNSLPDNRDDAGGGSVVNNVFYIVGGQSTTTTTPDVLIGTTS